MEVVNIADINSAGDVVLNDQKLLSLIMRFPYLYSPEVNPYGDEDYDNWAWEQITAEFNNNYSNEPCVAFTTSELRQRWCSLQPVVLSLSKMPNLNDIPEPFRQMLKKIGSQLEISNHNVERPFTTAQNIILANINMVEQLPLTQRRNLEAEIMELILNSEVESKSTLQLGPAEKKLADREYEEFIKVINIEKKMTEFNGRSSAVSVISDTDKSSETDANDCPMVEVTQTGINRHPTCTSPVTYVSVSLDDDALDENASHMTGSIKAVAPVRVKIKRERWLEKRMIHREEECLLEPMKPRKYIPLDVANLYVRNCVVRVKRCQMPVKKWKRIYLID